MYAQNCVSRLGILFKILKKWQFFGKNREIGKNREFFQILNFLYKSVVNVKIHFLTKFHWRILIFEEVMSFSVFTDLQGRWPGFCKNCSGYLSVKSCNFWSNGARSFKFCHIMPYMMYLKVTHYWGSRKGILICKTEFWRVVQCCTTP